MSMPAVDPLRIEEAGLNGSATPRTILYDGWLLRLSPGKAKRARSVNAPYPSSRPLAGKIVHCERLYESQRLPRLFRITPFAQPPELDAALAARGYLRFDQTLAQVAALERPPEAVQADVHLAGVDVASFVEIVGTLRGSPPPAREAHLERLRESALPCGRVVAFDGERPVACGQWMLDDDIVGVYDVVTAAHARNRGLARAVTAKLLADAWGRGARLAHLQVDEGNGPARAVYRRFGFSTLYGYHYRAPPGECE